MWEGLGVDSFQRRKEKLFAQVVGLKFRCRDAESVQLACLVGLPDDDITSAVDDDALEVTLAARGTMFEPEVHQLLRGKARAIPLCQTASPLS